MTSSPSTQGGDLKRHRREEPIPLLNAPTPTKPRLTRILSVKRPIVLDTPLQPDPYDPFFIPQTILSQPDILPQTNSKITELPPEILGLIFEKINVPYFQVCFALTCKTIALVASNTTILTPWRGYRDKDGLFRMFERKNNIPATLKLCRSCFVFKPYDPTYWEQRMNGPEFDLPTINWRDIFCWFAPSYNGHGCPRCTAAGYAAYFRESQYTDDRDLSPYVRRHPMCPDVIRRIEKP